MGAFPLPLAKNTRHPNTYIAAIRAANQPLAAQPRMSNRYEARATEIQILVVAPARKKKSSTVAEGDQSKSCHIPVCHT